MSQSFKEENIKENRPEIKCRIPQRLGSGKHRPLSKSKEVQQDRLKLENGKEKKENVIDESPIPSLSRYQDNAVQEQKISSGNFTNPEKRSPETPSNELGTFVLRNYWKLKREEYEQMRIDLIDKQGSILKVYAALKTIEEKLALMGHKISSSIIDDDLRIMNVAKLTPYQLLQLCEDTNACSGDSPRKDDLVAAYFNIDMETMYHIPSKVFGTCDAALKITNDVINCLQILIQNEKDLSRSEVRKKINYFKTGYDTLSKRVEVVKIELDRDLKRITDLMRKRVNKTITEGTIPSKDEEVNLRSSYRQRQINNNNNVFKLHSNKTKIEELERKLKEEKLKYAIARERLKKLESEAKINENHATRLKVALDQVRAENCVLERTIQNQKDQSEQSQKDFNEELCKLTISIKENAKNLEKIAEAKKTLQNEKEKLEERLQTLSTVNNKTISNLKTEINEYKRKVFEVEKKYKLELDEKATLQSNVQTLKCLLAKSDERHKETLELVHEAETKLSEALEYRNNAAQEITVVADNLKGTRNEIVSLKKKIIEQNVLIEEMQKELELTKMLEGDLRSEINEKTRHIEDQQNKYLLLEYKAKESELKLRLYEEQIMTLNEYINNFKHSYYGEGEKFKDVNETITEQNQKIQELNQRNGELTTIIQNQTRDLKAYKETISEQEVLIEEKNSLLAELTEKEKKQINIIECLQRSLASETHKSDDEVNGTVIEKDSEIKSLKVVIGRKEKRISQMEKVITALYDHLRKAKLKIKKYSEKNSLLKRVLSEYEAYADAMNADSPSEHFDRLIQILENEIETVTFSSFGKRNFQTNFCKCKIIESKQKP